ncbi:uncharacterized protein (DUF885 family) [Altererythrobacter atlanticus]|uniref:Uncharacterized protein n=1 Tax=Croceibacterium atlanticum TaxID=1267766 RepID=A0A0F7KTB7_9SPHN|nr:DUF885 domain-containing protein [Croceibacterium atlanticum]AKH42040.1 hypothetical protein WYH_00992 [Croceibacterium atlanticum]MBB5733392.1 uncharacterized protein (DUF885 family) [Croceibacterium atlanticum]
MPIPSETITRRQAIAGLGAGISLLALPGCARQALSAGAAPPVTLSPEEMLDQFAYSLLDNEPERATALGVDIGQHANLRSRLEDQSPEGQRDYAASLRHRLEEARLYPRDGLDASTRTSFEVVESAYANALEGLAMPYGDVAVGGWRNTPYVVIQNVGGYIDIPRFLDSDHPIRETADAEAYVDRLEQVPAYLDGELQRIRSAREMGLVPPDFLLDKAIPQMDASLADARSGGAMVESLVHRTSESDISGDWSRRALPIISGPVADALERQLAELRTQRAAADGDPGMWSQPMGPEWYEWALRASTTTSMTPDEIHEMGLTQLEEIHGRMDPILRDLGYTSGTVGDRMNQLSTDKRFQFAEGDAGRAEIMVFIRDRVDWIKAQMPRAFRTLVPGNLEIRRLPPAEEPGAPTAYGGAGSKDGTIPGKMWINLHTTDLHRKYDVPTLVHHETIPGHVWQGEYANKLPLIRSILAFNAYSEGWALYAEQLADELGAYADHPAWQLGYLQDQAFRACRLVVDTGLHHKRWGREQAIRFFTERNGNKRAQVESEVDRYCSWPGQACGYKVGHSEITRQRSRAQGALGADYDLRAFNDAVVLGGNVPLDVLAKNVDRYIAAASA